MKRKHHLRHDNTTSLFAPPAVSERAERTIRIEFDSGTPYNIPRVGYGDGYGSYKIDDEPICRLFFRRPMSANAAEVWTLVQAVGVVAQCHNPEKIALEIHGDSRIALARCKPRSAKKIGSASSDEFTDACARLSALCGQFGSVRTNWRGRAASVALFGH